jgi:tRNA threonylcarbamoyl adenosine modification protein YjeE
MKGASLEWNDLDEDALKALAALAAGSLMPGDIIVLRGELGTGKTTFVQTAARSLGVREAVTSPTYQFARRYEVRGWEAGCGEPSGSLPA